ncbi:hypothetical protein ACJIZ3_012687 [Penstemon smallii]|uniref:Uncharacterized protein n=1 Tax=Penstemon smallii TaxID=265156 RepID=A0ABD3UN41_9LAMI
MKFLLEFVACCGSCSSGTRQPAEETRLLVVQQEPRRRVGRKRGRLRGNADREWRPSLTSISEDNVLLSERINNINNNINNNNNKKIERPAEVGWKRSLKRKVSSMSQRGRSRSSNLHYDYTRQAPPTIMPSFAVTPFMF